MVVRPREEPRREWPRLASRETNMHDDHIESGWQEFLDRLKRFWGKLGGDAPTPAVG